MEQDPDLTTAATAADADPGPDVPAPQPPIVTPDDSFLAPWPLVVADPPAEESSTDESITAEATNDESITAESTTDDSIAAASTAEDSITATPTIDESITAETTADDSTAEEHGAPESTSPEPAVPAVAPPFQAFYYHVGPTLCGAPVGPLVEEDGVPTQYFEHLALEAPAPGQVKLKPIGAAAWDRRLALAARSPSPADSAIADIVDIADRLARHPSSTYSLRPLSDIRYLVLHHTGAPADIGPYAIAGVHVHDNDWPGIGYHFVVGGDGTLYRTQDLTVVSHHAAQFNPVSVGIALAGDFEAFGPPPEQLAATADLIARLCWDLGLAPDCVRGHREMVPTPCPGDGFLGGWKPRLMRAVAERLDARAASHPPGTAGDP